MLMWLHAFVARANPCTFRSFPRHERLGHPNLTHPFMTQRWVDCASGVRIHITIMEFHSRERVSLNGCLWHPTMKSIDIERESKYVSLLLLSRLWWSNPSVLKRLRSSLTRTLDVKQKLAACEEGGYLQYQQCPFFTIPPFSWITYCQLVGII